MAEEVNDGADGQGTYTLGSARIRVAVDIGEETGAEPLCRYRNEIAFCHRLEGAVRALRRSDEIMAEENPVAKQSRWPRMVPHERLAEEVVLLRLACRMKRSTVARENERLFRLLNPASKTKGRAVVLTAGRVASKVMGPSLTNKY